MAILGLGNKNKARELDSPVSHNAAAAPAPRVGDLTVGDYANGMPRIRLGEFFNSFARQLRWVIPLMLIGTAGAWYLTKDLKRTYTGEGRVLVQLGSEYVFQDATNQNASQGLTMTPDHIVLNEIGIMKNADIIEKVVGEMSSSGRFGQTRFAKDAFKKINAARNDADRQNAWVELYTEVERSFAVMPQPKSSIVDLSYKHEDPQVAVETLNAFIEEYLDARKRLFVEGSSDGIAERRRSTEEQLKENERKIARFLNQNGISDFDSERTGVTKRTEDLRTELNTLRGTMTEAERALATVEAQLRNTPEQIDLYVDDRTSQRVAAAELELKQLLAKYLPGSQPVRQKQTELAELRSLQGSSAGQAAGGRRIGPNPVFQELMTRRNTLQAQADSLREKDVTLQRQLDAADNKVRQLASLNPSYQNLLRERNTLDTRLKSYTSREQEAIVNQDQAEASSENVKVITYASRPRKGSNTRLLMFALSTVAWGLTLFMLALMRVFLDPKLYASSSVARVSGDRRADGRQTQTPYQQPSYAPPAEYTPDYAPQYAPAAHQGYDNSVPEAVPAPHGFGAAPSVAARVANMGGGMSAASAAPTQAPSVSSGGAVEYQPGAAQGYPGAATAYAGDPYAAQGSNPYAAGGYAPQPMAGYGGNAAVDYYANPYAQAPVQAQPHVQPQHQTQSNAVQTDVPVLGTVPPHNPS